MDSLVGVIIVLAVMSIFFALVIVGIVKFVNREKFGAVTPLGDAKKLIIMKAGRERQ